MAIPAYRANVIAAKEAVLREDLQVMRQAIGSYTVDKQKAPQSLEDLVSAGYLKAIPKDPITGRTDTWITSQSDDMSVPSTRPKRGSTTCTPAPRAPRTTAPPTAPGRASVCRIFQPDGGRGGRTGSPKRRILRLSMCGAASALQGAQPPRRTPCVHESSSAFSPWLPSRCLPWRRDLRPANLIHASGDAPAATAPAATAPAASAPAATPQAGSAERAGPPRRPPATARHPRTASTTADKTSTDNAGLSQQPTGGQAGREDGRRSHHRPQDG